MAVFFAASLVAAAPWEHLGPKNIAECAAEPDDACCTWGWNLPSPLC